MEEQPSILGPNENRRNHVDRLCDELKIQKEILAKGRRHAFANTAERRILIPETTRILSYYMALHEIGHVVLGADRSKPKASQEADAWRWAIENAIEPPSEGVRRRIFRAVWNYMLNDLNASPDRDLSNAERFPSDPDDPFWEFMASLDGSERLLYEAIKVTAHSGPIADARFREKWLVEEESKKRLVAVSQARVQEQLRFYGPPRKASIGELTLLGSSPKAHVWRIDGSFGTLVRSGDIYCGTVGVAHEAPSDAAPCRRCASIRERESPGSIG